MKAFSLLALRISTGLLCMIWGVIRASKPDIGAMVNAKHYGGLLSGPLIQHAWGAMLIVVGLLVVLGLFRRYAYPLQAAILCTGALAIWKHLVDPLGMWLLDRESAQVLFFPSLGMAAATLVLIAFRDDDRHALDARF